MSNSGKTRIGDEISDQLNIVHIKPSYKHYTKNNEELLKSIEISDKKFAKDFDEKIIKLAKENNKCIVTTWLGPWLIKDATLKIWLEASFEERAKRCSLKNLIPISDSKEFLEKKDKFSISGFKKMYNIDIMDHSLFDICINTEKIKIKKIVEIIISLIK